MKVLTCSVKHLSKIDLRPETVVVDVRSSPDNNPQWSREKLRQNLAIRGVKYGHMPELGGWPEFAVRTPDNLVDYVKTSETPEFQAAIDRVVKGCGSYKIVLACWCENPQTCHRRKLLGEALVKKGVQVLHLAAPGIPATPHWYDSESDGFSTRPHPTAEPKGLSQIQNWIDSSYEIELCKQIDLHEWDTRLSRRTQHYGYRYDYNRSAPPIKLQQTPKFIQTLLDSTNEKLGMNFNQVIVNEYTSGQKIGAHTDHVRQFGPTIATLSLLDETYMTLRKGHQSKNILLHARSLTILSDEARYKWTHELELKRGRRLSVTFRTVI